MYDPVPQGVDGQLRDPQEVLPSQVSLPRLVQAREPAQGDTDRQKEVIQESQYEDLKVHKHGILFFNFLVDLAKISRFAPEDLIPQFISSFLGVISGEARRMSL